jgi:hypothetical protein
MFEVEIGA